MIAFLIFDRYSVSEGFLLFLYCATIIVVSDLYLILADALYLKYNGEGR